jgi:hypothetical protein
MVHGHSSLRTSYVSFSQQAASGSQITLEERIGVTPGRRPEYHVFKDDAGAVDEVGKAHTLDQTEVRKHLALPRSGRITAAPKEILVERSVDATDASLKKKS